MGTFRKRIDLQMLVDANNYILEAQHKAEEVDATEAETRSESDEDDQHHDSSEGSGWGSTNSTQPSEKDERASLVSKGMLRTIKY